MITQETLEPIYKRFRKLDANEVWIDVRRPDEWAEGFIPGVKKIMLADLEAQLPDLDPEKTYVLVCRSGNRSNQAAELMATKGFEKLVNFSGGMLSWYQANYALAY
jgi:rhodanese-related sulfurtransferase